MGFTLFAVGDDWQSIYRFTGSDVTIMYEFEKYFGFSKMISLSTTYRFNHIIADYSSSFILKNKNQLVKSVFSDVKIESYPFEIKYLPYSENPELNI